jgi:hypothetical protein
MKVEAFRCDNKQCSKIVTDGHINTITVGTNSYDLCDKCIDDLNKIIKRGFKLVKAHDCVEKTESNINSIQEDKVNTDKIKKPKKSAQELDTEKIVKYGVDKLQQDFDNGESISSMANKICVSYQVLKQFIINNNIRYTVKKGPHKKEKTSKSDAGTSI